LQGDSGAKANKRALGYQPSRYRRSPGRRRGGRAGTRLKIVANSWVLTIVEGVE
jgi:hypothetical protein